MTLRILWLYLLVILPVTFANASQGDREELKEKLCKDWQYAKCRIMGVEYTPKKKESNDQFQFQSDMTFTTVEEGVEKNGTWDIIDAHSQLVSLQFSDGATKELKIEQLDNQALVYTIVADWQYDVTIYMNVSPPTNQIQANNLFHFAGQNNRGPKEGVSLYSLLFP